MHYGIQSCSLIWHSKPSFISHLVFRATFSIINFIIIFILFYFTLFYYLFIFIILLFYYLFYFIFNFLFYLFIFIFIFFFFFIIIIILISLAFRAIFTVWRLEPYSQFGVQSHYLFSVSALRATISSQFEHPEPPSLYSLVFRAVIYSQLRRSCLSSVRRSNQPYLFQFDV